MTTWVLLRGLMRDARHWGDFPKQFQHAMGAPDVVTLDFPGNGSLYTQTSPASVGEMANHCRTQLKQLGYAPPYRVLALSLGAMVAVEWSKQHPDEIEKLVLINTSLAALNPFYHRLRPGNYPGLIRTLIDSSVAQREKQVLRITSNTPRTPQQQATLLEQWIAYAQACPVTRANFMRQLRAAIRYRAASAPPSPVLLLAAEQDRLVNVKCSLTLAQRWGCAIKLHPTAGHDLPLDDGVWVAQQVHAWDAPN